MSQYAGKCICSQLCSDSYFVDCFDCIHVCVCVYFMYLCICTYVLLDILGSHLSDLKIRCIKQVKGFIIKMEQNACKKPSYEET